VALEIQAVLEEDLANGARLMLPSYRDEALKRKSLDGYCAAAAAAFFFLEGGRPPELQPMQLTHSEGSHWWIVKDGTTVIDLTLRPGEPVPRFPYDKGKPRGFMQTGYRRPSKRAKEIVDRVKQRRRTRPR
jgi:hypothetical protein